MSDAPDDLAATHPDHRTEPAASPYATGGGGVTLERRVAVLYLARLLLSATSPELRGRRVERIAFQQARPVDDLLVLATREDGTAPLSLSLAIRRKPAFVSSDQDTRKLVGSLLADLDRPVAADAQHRVAVCVAGQQKPAIQVGRLANLASKQATAKSFFDLVRTPKRFLAEDVQRLGHLTKLIEANLPDSSSATDSAIEMATWNLLQHLDILMPRVEGPDESDWADLLNTIKSTAGDQTLTGAAILRDRLESLAAQYAPAAANVDLSILIRDTADVLAKERLHNHANNAQGLPREDRRADARTTSLHSGKERSMARSAARAASLGLEPSQFGAILESIEKSVPLGLRDVSPGRLTILTGPLGCGKSELGEWWYRARVDEALSAVSPAHMALWLSMKSSAGRVDEILEAATATTGADAIDVVLDGLDEVSPSAASDIMTDARTFLALRPESRLIVTARPGLPTSPSDSVISIPGLALAESVALLATLTGRPGHYLYGWPAAIRDSLKYPLWVILASVNSGEENGPRSQAELLHWLVESALTRSRDSVTVASDEIFRKLKHAATLCVEQGGSIPTADIGGFSTRAALAATGLISADGHQTVFTLPIVEQWLAAQSLIEGDTPTELAVADLASIARWRYPLAVAIATGGRETVDRIMTELSTLNFGLANWVLSAVSANFGSASFRIDEPQLAARLHGAISSIDDAVAAYAGIRILPLSNYGQRATLGVEANESTMTVVVSPGWRADGKYVLLSELDGQVEQFLQARSSRIDTRACGIWQVAYSMLHERVKATLEKFVLDEFGLGAAFDSELRWAMCVDLAPPGSNARLSGQVDANQIVARCDKIIEAAGDAANPQGRISFGSRAYTFRQVKWLRSELSANSALAVSPAPPPDIWPPSGGWVWSVYSDLALLARVRWCYSSALSVYRSLVAAWFPTLTDVLGISCIRPVSMVGHLTAARGPHFETGPVLQYAPSPGDPVPATDTVDIDLIAQDESSKIETFWTQWKEGPLAERREQWRRRNPKLAEYGQFWRSSTAVDVFGERPASSIALKWLADDLKTLGFDKPSPRL